MSEKRTILRRIVSVSAAAICMLSSLRLSASRVTEADAALTGMTPFEIVKDMKIGWNLGNSLDATGGETAWGNPSTTKSMIDAVKAKGFNTLRVPTTWYEHLDGSNKIDSNWMRRVHEVVDYGIQNDMYVILNVHHENWVNVPQFNDDTYRNAEAKLTAIWSQVAEEFKDYDQHLIFEGMNEPRQTNNPNVDEWGDGSGDGGYTWNYVNNLNAAFVKTVRAQGSAANQERLLMLPGYVASSSMTAIQNIKIPENAGNVAYSVHAYLPYYFTMAKDDKANHNFPGQSGWGENYEESITAFFGNLKQYMNSTGVPVIIGEFGASNFNNTDSRVAWAKYYLTHAKEAGVPCVLWDNNIIQGNNPSENFGALNRNSCSWYSETEPMVDQMLSVMNDSTILWGGKPDTPDYPHDGDANCDGYTDMGDVVAVMRFYANPVDYPMSEEGKIRGDVIGNDGITNNDALMIQYFEAELITSLPVTQ